jgi:hypothetical protein
MLLTCGLSDTDSLRKKRAAPLPGEARFCAPDLRARPCHRPGDYLAALGELERSVEEAAVGGRPIWGPPALKRSSNSGRCRTVAA